MTSILSCHSNSFCRRHKRVRESTESRVALRSYSRDCSRMRRQRERKKARFFTAIISSGLLSHSTGGPFSVASQSQQPRPPSQNKLFHLLLELGLCLFECLASEPLLLNCHLPKINCKSEQMRHPVVRFPESRFMRHIARVMQWQRKEMKGVWAIVLIVFFAVLVYLSP